MDKKELASLWSQRFRSWVMEQIPLWRRIVNGFLFFPGFLVILGSYYYPLFLDWLPKEFPVPFLMALLFLLPVVKGGIMNYLYQADLSFLPAIENDLAGYFRRSFFLSWMVQNILLFLLFIVTLPLYMDRISSHSQLVVSFLLLLFLLKGWNLYLHGIDVRHQFGESKVSLFLIRLFGSFFLLWGLLERNRFFVFLGILLLLFLTFYMILQIRGRNVAWLHLLHEEMRIREAYARKVGLFIDLPAEIRKGKERGFFLRFLEKIIPSTASPYTNFLLLQWIRSENLWIYLRLFGVGLLFIILFPSVWVAVGMIFAVPILSMLQVEFFWRSLRRWIDLPILPIDRKELLEEMGKVSFVLRLLFTLMMIIPTVLLYPLHILQILGFSGASFFIGMMLQRLAIRSSL